MRRCRDGEVTMGEPKVKIVGITSIGEKMCAAGGRISTQEGTALEIWEKSQDEQKNENLIEKVTQSGHDSTIEHCFFNLVFDEVSVVTEQFMIEFRLASFTIKSRRYVDFSQAGYIIPEFNDDNLKEKYINRFFNGEETSQEEDVEEDGEIEEEEVKDITIDDLLTEKKGDC